MTDKNPAVRCRTQGDPAPDTRRRVLRQASCEARSVRRYNSYLWDAESSVRNPTESISYPYSVVPMTGLAPARHCWHYHLKVARMLIPTPGQLTYITYFLQEFQLQREPLLVPHGSRHSHQPHRSEEQVLLDGAAGALHARPSRG